MRELEAIEVHRKAEDCAINLPVPSYPGLMAFFSSILDEAWANAYRKPHHWSEAFPAIP